ncbi:MAG TPA: TIGR03936 family radical SAM-associated protein [Gemmataceae bacterium]|jgi:radical SAM-linked protein|nr:TIGR03936 family radical SAM-associated protein [Gemmataceae bacterium]
MDYSKVRIRFRKTGDLRLISHHDLLRFFERMIRRAELPMRWTQGFNPHPRLVFALPLSLGIVGSQEVVELELEGAITPQEVQTRLSSNTLPGIEILSVQSIDPQTTAHVCRAGYRVEVPPERRDGLPERIKALLETDHHWVERTRPKPRRFDLKPYLESLQFDSVMLDMILTVTPTGGVRPEEVLQALGLGDLSTEGAILDRNLLELEDEPLLAASAAPPATPLVPIPEN